MSTKKILGVVLKGGQSRRMGQDKAFVLLDGIPLLEHVCRRFAPQVDKMIINIPFRKSTDAISNTLTDALMGYATCADREGGSRGPLAGVAAAFNSAHMEGYEYLAVVPCDAPLIPSDLVDRLYAKAVKDSLQHICVMIEGYLQPTFSLWHNSLLGPIEQLISVNDYSLKAITHYCRSGVIEIAQEEVQGFCNINSPSDLQNLKVR